MADNDNSVHRFSAIRLDGKEQKLADFAGNVLLVVNTASLCGFTSQYQGLEQLYRTYKDRGLVVLGFPSNQFGSQEPGSASEIGAFCQINYSISFPMFAKIDVNGPTAHPLYRYLTDAKPGLLGTKRIKWNFTKFLVDRSGRVVARFAPSSKPTKLAAPIERLLTRA
ncbi:MAG: glutathione peroxidase [Acidobacteriota bacterium]|nr:glutathione peroxidase [Acidobacteriota bacterium]